VDPLLLNLHDYHRAARGKLRKEVLDYFEGGALDEITLRENTAGWERLKLYYHVLAGIGEHDNFGPVHFHANRGCADSIS